MTLPEIRTELSKMDLVIKEIVERSYRRREEWLEAILSKLMPPDLYLRAYGNNKCKLDVAKWLQREGYLVEDYPEYLILKKNGNTISRLEK